MKKLNFTCFVHISCLVLVFSVAGSSSKECGDPECKSKCDLMGVFLGAPD